jgi:hypothetical protein
MRIYPQTGTGTQGGDGFLTILVTIDGEIR